MHAEVSKLLPVVPDSSGHVSLKPARLKCTWRHARALPHSSSASCAAPLCCCAMAANRSLLVCTCADHTYTQNYIAELTFNAVAVSAACVAPGQPFRVRHRQSVGALPAVISAGECQALASSAHHAQDTPQLNGARPDCIAINLPRQCATAACVHACAHAQALQNANLGYCELMCPGRTPGHMPYTCLHA